MSKKAPKKEETPEDLQQAAAQAVQGYFTKDVTSRMNEMNDDQMFNTLRNLEQSEYWFALLRYVNKRLLLAQTVINSSDPHTQPTTIARTQGVMTGLTDIQNAVIAMVEAERTAADEAEQIRQAAG